MIDYTNRRIYVDYSTLSVMTACKEKCRLQSVLGYRSREPQASLDFGHAIHAGIQAYYDALAGGYHNHEGKWIRFDEPRLALNCAKVAFLRDLGINNANLPVNLEDTERRSVERGLYLLEAYVYRYRDELYENLISPAGEPYTEVPFKIYLTTFEGYEVYLVGYIDRLMRNMMTGRPVIFETKTTTQSLTVYVQQCKPNHQVTIYFKPAQELYPDIRECVWDAIFVSSRKPDLQKGLKERFFAYGIDIENDFKRQITSRSATDIAEAIMDFENQAVEYCKWLTSGARRWPRTAPGACHSYGGCQFRPRCSVNLMTEEEEKNFMDSLYVVDRWEPWKKVLAREAENG